MYRRRTCRHCRKGLVPLFPNQHVHPRCRPVRRKKLMRVYQREYQRKVRRELKRSWGEAVSDEA